MPKFEIRKTIFGRYQVWMIDSNGERWWVATTRSLWIAEMLKCHAFESNKISILDREAIERFGKLHSDSV